MSNFEFCVWDPYHGETEEHAVDHKWTYSLRYEGAFGAGIAAEIHAQHYHSQRDGWEASWPIVFRVREVASGKLFDVEVERESIPHFYAAPPKEVGAP